MTNTADNHPIDTSVFKDADLDTLAELYPNMLNPVAMALKNALWSPKLLDPNKLQELQFCVRDTILIKMVRAKEQLDELFQKAGFSNQVIVVPPVGNASSINNLETFQLGFKYPQEVVFNIGIRDSCFTPANHDAEIWEPCEPPEGFPLNLKSAELYRNRYNHSTFFIQTLHIGVATDIILQLMMYDLDNCDISYKPKGA